MKGIYQGFCQMAKQHPEQIIFRMITKEEPMETQMTNEGLKRLVELAGAYLVRQGVRAGDTVTLVTSYQIGTVVGILATMKIGAVLTVINSEWPEAEIRNCLEESQPKLIIADSAWAEKLSQDYQTINTELLASASFFKHYAFTEQELSYEPEVNLEKDVAIRMFTSGTTGKPQSVFLTQANFLASCSGIINFLGASHKDVILDITRPFHVTGLAACLATLLAGAEHIYLNDYPKIGEGLLRKKKVTIFLAVPKAWTGFRDHIFKAIKSSFIGRALLRGAQISTKAPRWQRTVRWFCRLLLKRQIQRKLTGKQFKFGVSGGSALRAQVKLDLAALGIPVIEAWGMTETSAPHIVMDLASIETKPASAGRPLPGFEANIIPLPSELQDPNQPEVGELVVRGPNLCKGYSDAKRTKATFTPEGWFKTGDIAYQDKDGYYYIVDRLKNLIVLPTGENVYPEKLHAEIEGKIPWIKEIVFFEGQRGDTTVVAAALHPDPEELDRLISKKPYTDEDIQQLAVKDIKKALAHLSSHEQLKSWEDVLVIHSPLEKTSTLDVKAYQYKQIFNARHKRRS
jgi:long-subunit acyl-CoA synthetase (AMP-forming)